MIARAIHKLRWPLLGTGTAALVLAATSGATGEALQLGTTNTSSSQTTLTATLASPVFKVVNLGAAAALRGDAQNGIGVNGVSVSGNGQQGESQSGIGLVGVHKATTGANPGVQGTTASTDPLSAGVLGKNIGGGPGLRVVVNAGAPPLAVNSPVKVANLNADLLDGLDGSAFWKLGGNAGTSPGTNFLGTSDNAALELKVNGTRALRLEPTATSPNVLGGFSGNGNDAGNGALGLTIGGGGFPGFANQATDDYGTVAGGAANAAGNLDADPDNATYPVVGGGFHNIASGYAGTVAGGEFNAAAGTDATVAGGNSNAAETEADTVGGGHGNIAGGSSSTVGGGYGNTASGGASTIPGGSSNTASGSYSFAAGTQAAATQDGAFVWGDNTLVNVISPAANTFTVRASGGIWLGTNSSPAIGVGHFIDTSTGAFLSSSGTWTNNSDRAKKHDFRPLSTKHVLEQVARMPITSWSYKAEKPSVRHIGPMAQDFYAAFGLGLDDKHITTIDEGGVALAAIQGLYRRNAAVERENKALKARLTNYESENAALSVRLARLEHLIGGRNQ
jgi:hypothetical protein